MVARPRLRHARILQSLAAVSLLAGCSLQNFDYLSKGAGPPDSGAQTMPDATSDAGPVVVEAGADAPAPPKEAGSDAQAVMDSGMPVQEAGGPDVEVADAGSEAGTVGGNLLANWSFEQGYLGWTFTPSAAMGKYAFEQMPIGSGSRTIDGSYELATWSGTDSFTVQVSQTLTNLPDGSYSFNGYFNCGVNNQAYIFARGCGAPDQQVNIGITSATSWSLISIPTIQVSGGSCQVGFYVDASPSDWLNADAFTFELTPTSPEGGAEGGSDDGGSDDGGSSDAGSLDGGSE